MRPKDLTQQSATCRTSDPYRVLDPRDRSLRPPVLRRKRKLTSVVPRIVALRGASYSLHGPTVELGMLRRAWRTGATRTKTSRCRRWVARTVLVTFTTSLLACGSALGETATTLPAGAPPPLSKQELHDLVAPVALYPDVVLASLLPATTFPDQLHDAAGFVGQAEQVDNVPTDRGWDGSVVGLLQFPDVLRWLDTNPAWTDQMGQAVTYQQGDVLDAIQGYRRAVANVGNLKSNQYQKVRVVPDKDILIEPARPDVVYVPSYDPVLATQAQPAQVVQESSGINPWLAFGGGAVVGALGAWALYSIFDSGGHQGGGYYNGQRRIRAYNNYYYARGRRPLAAAWTPRPRAYRARPQGWQQPQRLRYASPSTKAVRRAALRPPMTGVTAQAPPPAKVLQEQRQEKQQIQQQQRQEQQAQGQEKQQIQKQQRQEQQGQRQEKQQNQKQQRQGQRRQQRQQKQVKRQQKRAAGGGHNANPNAKRKKGQGKNR